MLEDTGSGKLGTGEASVFNFQSSSINSSISSIIISPYSSNVSVDAAVVAVVRDELVLACTVELSPDGGFGCKVGEGSVGEIFTELRVA